MQVGTNVSEETAASILFYPEDGECRFFQNKDITEPNYSITSLTKVVTTMRT